MKQRLLDIARGVGAAVVSMVVFAVPVGCFVALLLLVLSMEEGGDNLSALALPLTEAVVLLAQGTGFRLGSVTLTLLPLLLTGLLVALVAQVAARLGATMLGGAAGLAAWIAMDVAMARATTFVLEGDLLAVVCRGALVFLLGYLVGGLPGSPLARAVGAWAKDRISAPVRRAVRLGLVTGAAIVAVALVMGTAAAVTWIARGYDAMVLLFDMDGMGNGSRWLTSVACLFWLPNLVVWAVAWCCGAGFAIGDVAAYSLWAGTSDGLPPLPAFAAMPAPVAEDWARIAIQAVVPAAAVIIALLVLFLPRGFRVRPPRTADGDAGRRALLDLAYPAASFCVAAAVVAVGMSVLFALSNGGLGTGRLARVGVEVQRATQGVGRSAATGLTAAWLAAAVLVAGAWGLHWLWQSRRLAHSTAHHTDHTDHKEGTDDAHEPSDQEGPGLGLPQAGD